MKSSDATGEGKAGNRLGCLLVTLPFLAFAFVMPDAIHVWDPPFANPLLWIAGGIVIWLGLRWLIEAAVKSLPRALRRSILGLMILCSGALAVLILMLV